MSLSKIMLVGISFTMFILVVYPVHARWFAAPTNRRVSLQATSQTITYIISSNDRDAWSGMPFGSPPYQIHLSGYDPVNEKMIFVGNDSMDEAGAMSFSINIPKGATIDSAFLTLYPSPQQDHRTGSFEIKMFDLDNTGAFTESNNSSANLAGLAQYPVLNSPSVMWSDPNAWTVGSPVQIPTADKVTESTAFTSMVQNFINRPNYQPGNYIGFVFTKGTLVTGAYYGWEDFSAGRPPTLTVTYTIAGSPTPQVRITPLPKNLLTPTVILPQSLQTPYYRFH